MKNIPVKSIPLDASEGTCVPSSTICPGVESLLEYSNEPFVAGVAAELEKSCSGGSGVVPAGAALNTVSSSSRALGNRAGVSGA